MVPKSIVGPVDGAWHAIKAIINMEHDVHLYHRWTLANDPILGNSDFHYEQIAGGLGL